MKLSFSTRGWDHMSWDEYVETALEINFAGIEINNPQERKDLMNKGGAFHKYNVTATARTLKENAPA